ncbi:TPA: LysR family transcriptional regulator [Vibrio harveyi]
MMNRVNRYFLTVARTGNIKKASELLHVTQPTLTTAIKKLESDMSVSLLIRRSKGVELTEYGQVFLRYVEEQQEKHLDLMHKIQDMHQREHGKLKIGVGEAWWELFVRHGITKYQEAHPHSSLYIEFGNNLSLMQHLIQGDIDLFIGHEIGGLKDLMPVVFRPLFQDQESFFVHRDHPLLNDKMFLESPSEAMSAYPLIRVTPGHSRYSSVLNNAFEYDQIFNQSNETAPVVYEVGSLLASLDLLETTNAIMPYSDKMNGWMEKNGVKCLHTDTSKIGNVGIYHKRQLDNDKAQFLINEILTMTTEI